MLKVSGRLKEMPIPLFWQVFFRGKMKITIAICTFFSYNDIIRDCVY